MNRYMVFYFAFVLMLLIIFCRKLHCKYVSGILQTKEKWVFLTRFCFLSQNGELTYDFEIPTSLSPIQFLLYYDEPNQWYAVYKQNVPCEQAIQLPYINKDNYQVIELGTGDSGNDIWTGCNNEGDVIRCKSTRTFMANRERWWFLALARCSNKTLGGLFLKYNLHMLNGDEPLTKELSADEFYILETDIGFLFAFVVLLILASICAHVLRERMLFHTTYKMFLASLVFILLSLLISCIAYGKLANSGFEDSGLETFGKALDSISYLIFLLMLLLMGKGYNITRGRLSKSSSIKIYCFMALYTIIFVILFFNQAVNSDPGLVLYIYESVPGYGLLALRIIAWFYFTFACFMTLKHYPEKKKFYYPFFGFYTVWFLIGPVFVLIACFAIPRYRREKIVNGIEMGISFLAHCYLLFLTRPSNSNKNFPYHVRTSQVGILAEAAGPDDKLDFTRGAYDPSSVYEQTGPDFRNMFNIVRNVYCREGAKSNRAGVINDDFSFPTENPPAEQTNDQKTRISKDKIVNGNPAKNETNNRRPSGTDVADMFITSK